MQDMKTTIAGVITGILAILASLGIGVPSALHSDTVVGIIAGIGAMVIGVLAKDAKKSEPAKPMSIGDDPMKGKG